MARIARVVIPGIPHHVVNRGNRKQRVFFKATDYMYFLEMLSLYSRIYKVRIISYCLMSNHIHLIAIPSSESSLSHMMIAVQKSYTRMINFREAWKGCLWQGRYFLVPWMKHTLLAARYTELNPIKARIISDFGMYPYSSAAFHLGIKKDPIIDEAYFDFLPKEWRAFVESDYSHKEGSAIKAHINSGRPLGSLVFVKQLEAITGRTLKPKKRGPKKKQQ